ncbi:MAG: hypothetical protein ACI9OJ_005858, partial [Myxococcota bacterium]
FLKRWGLETSGFWDDAMWELSLVYHRQKRFKDEIRLLGDFIYTREETWLGSYELKNYKFAHLRIAKIYYVDYQDFRKAAEIFAEFPGQWPYSIFQDDALWWEAHAWRKAGEHALAETKFAELMRRWPDSKYTRRVKEGAAAP